MQGLDFDLEFSMEAPTGGALEPGVHTVTIKKFFEIDKTKNGNVTIKQEFETEDGVTLNVSLFAPTKKKNDGSVNDYYDLSVKSFQQRLSEFFLGFFPQSDLAGASDKFNKAMVAAKKAGNGVLTLENIAKSLKASLPKDHMDRKAQVLVAFNKNGAKYTDLAYGGYNGDVGVFSAHPTRTITITKKFEDTLGKNKRGVDEAGGTSEKPVKAFFGDDASNDEDPFGAATENNSNAESKIEGTASESDTPSDNPFA